ncbi:MAG TPA: hypothetical protein VFX70_02530 [Mycobacteriales bacterium]|nr:hypothetical protein [Mycobacteriales bacterium]
MAGVRLVRVVTGMALAVGVVLAGLTAPAAARDEQPAAVPAAAVPIGPAAPPRRWVASWTASPGGTLDASATAHRSVRDVVRAAVDDQREPGQPGAGDQQAPPSAPTAPGRVVVPIIPAPPPRRARARPAGNPWLGPVGPVGAGLGGHLLHRHPVAARHLDGGDGECGEQREGDQRAGPGRVQSGGRGVDQRAEFEQVGESGGRGRDDVDQRRTESGQAGEHDRGGGQCQPHRGPAARRGDVRARVPQRIARRVGAGALGRTGAPPRQARGDVEQQAGRGAGEAPRSVGQDVRAPPPVGRRGGGVVLLVLVVVVRVLVAARRRARGARRRRPGRFSPV